MKINFYDNTSGTPKIVITMELVDGKIKSSASPKFRELARGILLEPGVDKEGKLVSAKENPEEFLASMPNTYLGSYFRAEVSP